MVSLSDVQAAQERIAGHIIRTPLIYSPTLSTMTGASVYLKLETLQKAGSFKVRGATNKILAHRDGILVEGVVAASAGNHAQGVVVAANSAGIPATIVMPEWASLSKQEATRGYGARVIIYGKSLEESIGRAMEISRDGALFIHPFDDDEIIAGQGTIGAEILTDLPQADTIVVPVGGGGLIAGIAIASKALRPSVKIIGVQASACPSALDAIQNGGATCLPARKTIADGIRVEGPGPHTLPAIRELVDHIAIASENEIADAMLLLLERKHIIAEGAGAVPVAALMNGSIEIVPGSNIVLVISGGNVDSPRLFRIIRQSLFRQGRIMRITVRLEDQPGTLTRLLGIVAEKRGNILHISHSPGEPDIPVYLARVELELETRGRDHAAMIRQALEDEGYELR